MKMARHALTLALAAGLALGSQVMAPPASYALGQSAQTDNNIQAQLQNELKKYKNIQISVKNGVVDLSVGLGQNPPGYHFVTSPPAIVRGVACVRQPAVPVRERRDVGG